MTPKKILFPFLGVTIIGTAVAGGYFFMSPNNIKELLISEGTMLLDINGNKNEKY